MRRYFLPLSIATLAGLLVPVVAAAPFAKAEPLPLPVMRVESVPFASALPLAALKPSSSRKPLKVIGENGAESLGIKMTAARVIVVDDQTGEILYERDADKPGPIASITKLMTSLVLRGAQLDWNKKVTIKELYDEGGFPYFAPGDVVTVRDLWNTMLIGSSNTAAIVLASVAKQNTEAFVAEMNAVAGTLGMANSRFVDPTGLSADNLSTAHDVALLAKAAFTDPEIVSTVKTRTFTLAKVKGRHMTVGSTDKLLSSFVNQSPYTLHGAKTGFINESGYNIALSVQKDDAAPITVVVLGSASTEARFQEAKSLIYWSYKNYEWPSHVANRN